MTPIGRRISRNVTGEGAVRMWSLLRLGTGTLKTITLRVIV